MNHDTCIITYPAVYVGTEKTEVFFYTDIAQLYSTPDTAYVAVSDTHIVSLYPQLSYVQDACVLPFGEECKTLESVSSILEQAAKRSVARDGIFYGIGGGVICDMTAFAASIYMRGAAVVLVPTTLLAMVDAAIGGKTACDFFNSKNMIGTFYPAKSIHICTDFLKTLTDEEYRSGMAEVLKTALLYAPELYTILKEEKKAVDERESALLLRIIKRCVQAKAQVVEVDLLETGVRMHLNLGHTFAHALESLAGFGAISHGDAVAWGIVRALALGVHLGITEESYASDVTETVLKYGWETKAIHPILHSHNPHETACALLERMKTDKKKKNGEVRFILQRELNSTLVQTVPDEDVLAVLQ